MSLPDLDLLQDSSRDDGIGGKGGLEFGSSGYRVGIIGSIQLPMHSIYAICGSFVCMKTHQNNTRSNISDNAQILDSHKSSAYSRLD